MRLRTILLCFAFIFCLAATQAQTTPTAKEILSKAFEQATKENKNVFIMFHASWCGWCHKMDDSMNDSAIKAYFDNNYVITHLVVQEQGDKVSLNNAGAEDILKKYHGDKQGIPFWLIFDGKGNLLADCLMRPAGASLADGGENTGCPSAGKEIVHFIAALQKSSSLNEKQLQEIATRFKKNNLANKSK